MAYRLESKQIPVLVCEKFGSDISFPLPEYCLCTHTCPIMYAYVHDED